MTFINPNPIRIGDLVTIYTLHMICAYAYVEDIAEGDDYTLPTYFLRDANNGQRFKFHATQEGIAEGNYITKYKEEK